MKHIYLLLSAFYLIGCQQTGSAPKLQSHLASAQNSSAKTGQHINSIKTHLDTADYKGSRARQLLDKGVETPQ